MSVRAFVQYLDRRSELDIVAAGGTGFAFPSQTLYVAPDEGLDAERTRAAEDFSHRRRRLQEIFRDGSTRGP